MPRNYGQRKENLSPVHMLEMWRDLQGASQTESTEGRTEQVQMDRHRPSHDP